MKRFLLLLFILLLTDRTFGQTDRELAIQNALQVRTITELEQTKGKYRFTKEHASQLNSGIVQTNWQLGKRKRKSHVGLLTLSKGNDIIYLEVYNWDFNDDFTDWKNTTLEIRTTAGFESDLINPEHLTRLPYRSTFGYNCYAAPQIPRDGKPVLNFIEERDLVELTNWLNSINPVLQAYAYFGFSLLETQGIEINPTTKELMNSLKDSDIPVYRCVGCTVWETVPISELLTDAEVRRFIQLETE